MQLKWRGKLLYITGWEPNAPYLCEQCGAPDNGLRPFGKNKEFICHDCAQKDHEMTMKQMDAVMKPADLVVTFGRETRMPKEELEKILAVILPMH
jgi:hypothetical protein